MISVCKIFASTSRISFAVLCLTLLVAGNAHALGNVWVTMAPMPTARAYTTSGAIGSKLYVVTGSNTTANEVYDATTDSWAVKAPIPTNRAGASAGAIAGKLYVVGGCYNSDCSLYINTLEMYDPGTNTWVGKAPMPTSRAFATAGVIAGKLYVVGGFQACGPCTGINTLEVYDPSTNAWTTKASMPTARSQMGSAVINGQLYVVGGDNSTNTGVLATLEVYDPVADAWATKAPMPTAREGVGAGTVGGILYAVSGDDRIVLVNNVEAYDPVANTWSTVASIPTARGNSRPQGISGVLYVAGNGDGLGPTSSVLEAYIPPPIEIAIDIKAGVTPNTITLATDRDITVALLSSSTFNAPATVDRTSLTFGRTGSEASRTSCNTSPRDVNGDNRMDLVCHFSVAATGFLLGDTVGNLKGLTLVGNAIHGSDTVVVH